MRRSAFLIWALAAFILSSQSLVGLFGNDAIPGTRMAFILLAWLAPFALLFWVYRRGLPAGSASPERE